MPHVISNFGDQRLGDIAKHAMKDFCLNSRMLQHDDPTIIVEGDIQSWLRGSVPKPDKEGTVDGETIARPKVGDGVLAACIAIATIHSVPPPRVMGYMLRFVSLKHAKELSRKHKVPLKVGPRFHFYPYAETTQIKLQEP